MQLTIDVAKNSWKHCEKVLLFNNTFIKNTKLKKVHFKLSKMNDSI